MSDSESQISEISDKSEVGSTYTITESESDDYGVGAYQDEPLAQPGENALRQQVVDEDGILAMTLDARQEGEIPLNEW